MGIEAALAEIIEKRGKWFDADVVAACVRLFREKRFTFEAAAFPTGPLEQARRLLHLFAFTEEYIRHAR